MSVKSKRGIKCHIKDIRPYNQKFAIMTKPDQENNLIFFVYKSGVAIFPGLAIRIRLLLPHFCK